MKKDCITGLAGAAFFSYFLFACGALSSSAAFWPRIICIVGLCLCMALAAVNAIKLRKLSASAGQERLSPLSKKQCIRCGLLLLVLAVWTAFLEWAGFLAASTAALILIFLLYEPYRTKKRVVRDIAVAIVFSAGMYALFAGLGVSFPRGLFL